MFANMEEFDRVVAMYHTVKEINPRKFFKIIILINYIEYPNI